MRSHTAADGQDALRRFHAGDVFGRGFKTYQNDFFASCVPSFCVVSGEDDFTAGSAGGSAETFARRGSRFQRFRVELRVQEGVKVSRVDHCDSLFLVDHAFVDEVAGNFQSRLRGSLTVSGLEHIKFAGFNGELHILHVTVMIFQNLANFFKLFERFGELLFHFADVHRGANTGNNVFALCVGEEFTEQAFFAGRGVTGERNAGTAVVAHVAERHHLDVNGSTPGIRDIVVTTVNIGAGVVPGTENRFDSAHELFFRVGREIGADFCFVFGFELAGKGFEVFRGQVDVLLNAFFFFHLVDELFKVLFADFHNNVGVHLNESSVAVPSPTGVAGFLRDCVDNVFVKAEVQNGIHHAGHGSSGAGTNGNQQRVFLVAELFAGDLFHLLDVFHDLCLDFIVDLSAIFIVSGAGFGCDGEALRYGKTEAGHFREVRALAAEQVAHVFVTL